MCQKYYMENELSSKEEVISRDEVIKTVRLGSLDPEQEDIETLTREVNNILGYINQLQRVDVSSIAATSHVTSSTNVMREDIIQAHLPVEEALQNAPATASRFFKVPLIIEG